jgi:outer membrane protein
MRCLFAAEQKATGCTKRLWLTGMGVALVCSLVSSLPVHAQTPSVRRAQTAQTPPPEQGTAMPASTTERVLELSLEDAIRLALQNNLDIERDRFNPLIAHTDVEQARAAFDPAIGLETSISQTKSLPTTEIVVGTDSAGNPVFVPRRPFSKDGEVTPLFKQQIITGGNYELRFVNTRQNISPTILTTGTRTLQDPRFESSLELTFIQPLLRDFGIAVNTAPIRRAQKAEEIAEERLLQTILDVVFRVQEVYWGLVFRIGDLAARRESQKLAEDFLAENKVRVELGTLAPIELVQAETQVKIREEDVIVAEAAVRDAEDTLQEVLNIPEMLGTWALRVRLIDKPAFTPVSALTVEEQVVQALKSRPDILESRLDIASRQIARDVARNQLLPRLDFEAQGALRAFGAGADDALGTLSDAEGYLWFLGLRFEYPLGNRAARNEFSKRSLELQQALVEQRRIILTIVREIRQAVRDIETSIKRVEVTRAATVLAQTQLEAEQEKFRLGLSTSFRVLEFQTDLTDARSAETRALSDYNVDLAQLDQRTGTLRNVPLPPEAK